MELTAIVREGFEKAFPGEDFSSVKVVPTTDPRFGDYQCNDALKVAKRVGDRACSRRYRKTLCRFLHYLSGYSCP